MYFDGQRWYDKSLGPADPAQVPAVWGIDRENVFVAGATTQGGLFEGVVLQHGGHAWSTLYQSLSNRSITAVWASAQNDIFIATSQPGVVGEILVAQGQQLVGALQFPLAINGLMGRAFDDVYAVGEQGAVWRFTGGAFTSEVAAGTLTMSDLNRVWVSAGSDDVFAVGDAGAILRYDGQMWRDESLPDAGDTTLTDVWGSSPTDVYAVGGTAMDGGVVVQFDGQQWQERTLPDELVTGIELLDVWGTGPDNVFVAGAKSMTLEGILLHYNGQDWQRFPVPRGQAFSSVWGTGPDDVFVGGALGDLLHYDGDSWAPIDIGSVVQFVALHGTPDGRYVYAAAREFASNVSGAYRLIRP